jgi:hypothetical protein
MVQQKQAKVWPRPEVRREAPAKAPPLDGLQAQGRERPDGVNPAAVKAWAQPAGRPDARARVLA